MPDWKIHTISALLVYTILFSILRFSPDFGVMALFLLLLSGILPDLDHPRSLIRYIIGIFCSIFISLIFFISMEAGLEMRLLSGIIMFALVFLIFRMLPLRHRGRRSLHKWKLGAILFLACAAISWFVKANIHLSLFILIGYWLHLGLDRIKYKR